MKYIITKLTDTMETSRERAIEEARNKLAESDIFAAIYGKKINNEISYFTPILVDEKSLQEEYKKMKQEDPNASIYVLYNKKEPEKKESEEKEIKDELECLSWGLDIDYPLLEIEYENGEKKTVENWTYTTQIKEAAYYILNKLKKSKDKRIENMNDEEALNYICHSEDPNFFELYEEELRELFRDEAVNDYIQEEADEEAWTHLQEGFDDWDEDAWEAKRDKDGLDNY